MSRNALIITYTYYQLIVAIQLKRTILHDDIVDIIITNHSDGSEETAERLRKEGLFRNVYYIHDNDGINVKKLSQKIFRYLKARLFPENTIREYIELKENYEMFFFSTPGLLTHLIAFYLSKKLECYRFEDGYSTYTRPFLERTPIRKLLIKLAFGNLEKKLKGIYLYHPELFLQKAKCPVHSIKLLDRKDEELKGILNHVFDYDNNRECYDVDYIFLEESFRASGVVMDDEELIEFIAETVGYDNLVIKRHPRNKCNTEVDAIKSSKMTGQPWELILMNEEFSGKTLFTITSGASFASVLFNFEPVRTCLLFKCVKNKSPMLDDMLLEYISRINTGRRNIIVPENREEFLKELIDG